jgi:ATP-dependent Clp protease adaptor protein ClpS
MTKELVREAIQPNVVQTDVYRLVLFNDHVNTFDWVIESLVQVCGHTLEQAEQCAWFVHTKGKYCVKHGSLLELEPKAHALAERGLTVEIQEQ